MVNRIDTTESLDGQHRTQPSHSQASNENGLRISSRVPGSPSNDNQVARLRPTHSDSSALETFASDSTAIKKRSFLANWFCNLPIGRKQAIALIACELVPIVGFGIGSTLVFSNSLQTQLLEQAKSEVAVTETNYNIKVNQMGASSRGQSDNPTIINAARAWKRGEILSSDLQTQVKQILRNEVKARKMEYATLVGKDLRIVANANSNRQGETFNPDNLVSQVLKTPQQIKANAVVSWNELTKEGATLPAGDLKKDALIRYVVTPIQDPDTNEVIAALVFGDIVNNKLPIVESTLKSLGGGYSSIYLRQSNGAFALATGLNQSKEEDLNQAQSNVPLPSTSLLAAAAANNGEAVTERIMVNGHSYTMAAVAVPNQVVETSDGVVPSSNGKPVAILVRGTSESNLNDVMQSSLIQEVVVLALGVAAILLWSAIFRRAVLRPLKHLEQGTQDFANGDRSARVEVFSLDEVGQLAMTFNEMADNIVETENILSESIKGQELQAKQAELLNKVIVRIRQTLDFDSIVQTGVDEIRDFLKADRVLIYTFHEGWVSGTITAESVGPGWIKALGRTIEDPLVDGAIDRYNSGRIWYTNNIYKDQLSHCHCQILEQLQVKANIVAPIRMNGRLIGLLCAHQCDAPRDWQPAEIDLFGQLAAQISYALDQANLLKQQELITQQAHLLNQITHRLRQSLDREQIHTTVVKELRQALTVDRAVVYLFDENWQGSVVAESVGRGYPAALGANIADPCFAQAYVEKYKRGRIQALANIYEANLDKCYLGQLEPFEVKANIVAPILVNEKLLGLLVVHQCSASRQWQEGEIDLMRQVAIQLGFALEQATLLEQREQARLEAEKISQEQRQQKETLQKLNIITTQLRQSLDPEQIHNAVVRELRQALTVDRAVVYLFDENWQGRIVAESVKRGYPAALGANIVDPCFVQAYVEKYKQGRVQALSNIYEANLDKCYLGQLEPFEVKANIVAPILVNEKLLGLLVVHQCSNPRKWHEEDINLMRQVAIQLGFALEQANLLKQQQEKATVDRLLNEVTLNIRQTLVREEVLKIGVRELRKALTADRVVVYFFNSDRTGTVVAESVAKGYKAILGETVTDPLREGLIDQYRDGRVCVMHDVYAEELTGCHVELLEGFEIRASITAPILEGERLLGLLCVHQCSGLREWQDGEVDFFRKAAIQIGFSLEQSTLLEQREQALLQAELISEEQRQQKEMLQMQLVELLSDVEGASRGDLTVRADVTVGEIGTVADFFNSIVESLRQIVTQVKQSTLRVNMALGENDGAIRQLADEATKQAEEANLTLQSVEQMTQSIQAVADNASLAAQVTQTASATAQAGGTAMDLTVQNILSLRDTIGETAKKVKRLGESSQKISKVVSLINQIALQTNLLAINAGIEAARAGEEGQGFAVVAEEVGELAARSAAATQEIEQIVENIQRETSEVVEAMEQGTTQVVEGTYLVENAKESLEQILQVSRQIDHLVQSISDATVSQVETSQTITHLMEEVASIAGRTSNSSRQVSKSLRETVEIAQELQESVETFKVG